MIDMKTMIKFLLCFTLLAGIASGVLAQQKTEPTKKFKPPVVKVYLGGHQNGDSISKETAKILLPKLLQVLDSKKIEYTVENYQFLYRKKSFIQNAETGKPEEVFTISAGTFTETPLPKIWIENVGYQLQKGEEFYFFDIIVNDQQGNRFLAPDFKLFISK